MQKKVFIHVGPPKTGTSAIQNWFSENTKTLLSKGIYYPKHALDPNGVSSGNLSTVCDIIQYAEPGKAATIQLSEIKISGLLEEFDKSDCHCLFLSSEYFIQHMVVLKKLIPNVCFIAYLRNPIEIIESNYNQGVKRAGFSHTINLASFNTMPHVNYLLDYVDNVDKESLILRFYEVSFNGTASLIDDVLTLLEVDGVEVAKKSVNNSYHFEALEVKRWLNNFHLGALENKIDHALQSFNIGQAKFSLIPPDRYEQIKSNYHARIKDAFNKLGIENSFIEFGSAFTGQSQATFKKQELEKEEFLLVMSFLKKSLKEDFDLLRDIVYKNRMVEPLHYLDWFEHANSSCKDRTLGKIKEKLWSRNSTPAIETKQMSRNELSSLNPVSFDLVGLDKFRKITEVPPNVQDADLLRELAFLLEVNGQLDFSIVLLQKAVQLRPGGKFIVAALEEFSAKNK
jgi:hypothetical protein